MSKIWKFLKMILPPVVIIIITIVMCIVSYKDILKTEEEICWARLEDTAGTINNEITVRFKDNISNLKLVANTMIQEDRVQSYEAITSHLNDFQPMTIFSRIDILYPDNTVLLQTGERVALNGDYSFDKMSANNEHMSRRINDPISGNEAIYYTVPVASTGNTQALLVGVVYCKDMPALFQAQAYDGEAVACLVDYVDGSFIMDDWHPKLGNVFEMKQRKQLKGYENVNFFDEIRNAKTGANAYESDKNGENSFMYYTPVGIFDWQLLIVVQEPVAFASLLKLKSTFLMVGAAEAVLLMCYFLWTIVTVSQLDKSKRESETKQEELEFLSYYDALTKVYNRNKYNEVIEEYQNQKLDNIGIAFFDINGLKRVNDEQGHKFGDKLIQDAAKQISAIFQDQTYRIGGDEFVILSIDMTREAFYQKIQEVLNTLETIDISMSVGISWESLSSDLNEQLKEADERMYKEKRLHYQKDKVW